MGSLEWAEVLVVSALLSARRCVAVVTPRTSLALQLISGLLWAPVVVCSRIHCGFLVRRVGPLRPAQHLRPLELPLHLWLGLIRGFSLGS